MLILIVSMKKTVLFQSKMSTPDWRLKYPRLNCLLFFLPNYQYNFKVFVENGIHDFDLQKCLFLFMKILIK